MWLKHSLRNLVRKPGFAALSVLTLALAIGANAAIFSIINGVLLRPLPFPNAHELYGLWHAAPGLGFPQFEQSNTTFTLYRELNQTFVDIGLSDHFTVNLTSGGEPIRVPCASATSSLFRALRVPPEMGRVFTQRDDRMGGEQVVILSYELWRGRFGADPDILGKTITLNASPWEVIGVMPAGFTYPGGGTELWIPHRIDPAELGDTNFSYEAVGRLKPGVTPEAATADLNQLLARLPEVYPGELTKGLMDNAQMSVHINPLLEDVVGDVGQVLWILLGTVGFVLLIACANVANLFLVRAEGRRRDVALRTALGAGRGDLIRSFLTESIALSVLGGTLGLGLAYASVRVLVALSPENIPRLSEIGIDTTVLAFTGVLSVVAGLVFGAFPILRYRRQNVVVAINEGSTRSSVGREGHHIRNLLVVTQVALALILLIGSGLMARTFWELRSVDPGFRTDGILTLRLSLPFAEYESSRDAADFYQQLLDDFRALPGVVEAGAISNLPLADGSSNSGYVFEDFPLEQDELPPIIRNNRVAPGYFEAMGIPLREGRTFERRDHDEKTGAVIVSARLADHFWPGKSAVGKRVSVTMRDPNWYTIVGVIGDVRDDGLEQLAPEMIYFPMVGLGKGDEEWVARTMSVVIRTNGSPTALAGVARETVWAINPRLPVANIRALSEIVSASMARTSYAMLLLAIAAGVAILLGTVGIYGVVSYVVSQRTREIGIRMALGAERRDVSRMVLRQGLLISMTGIAIGVLGALGLTRLLANLLFGVSSLDPPTFAAVSFVLFTVTALAAYLPARRAAAIHPMEALRYE
jgi:putative ABC transport system permease protein